jgi:cyclic pyranopterin phosphate synthase
MKKTKHSSSVSDKVFLVMVGFVCNNNCLMCSVRPKGLHYKPRQTKEIIADLERGRELQYERVEFTGGDPTVRTDLLLLMAKAKELGYNEIALSTNARTLSSLNFLDSLKKAGLNRVTTTLYGYNFKNHEVVTRTPDSFRQTVQGIKNSLSLGITTTVNTVVFSLTAKNLKKIGEFLNSLGIKYWTLLDLIPDGYALDKYDILALSPSTLTKVFNSIEPILDKFSVVNIFDFPFCLIPSKIFKHKNCNILAAQGRTNIINQVGYKPKRFFKERDVYYDIHKTLLKQCEKCIFYQQCGGIWTPYIKLFDTKFVKPIINK